MDRLESVSADMDNADMRQRWPLLKPITGLARPDVVLVAGLLMAAVVACVVVTHWPVLSAQATAFDDSEYLFNNPTLLKPGWASAKRVFREVLHSPQVDGYYEPLTLVSLMIDVARGGAIEQLRPFHQVSLALHVLNTLLVIVLIQRLFGNLYVAAGIGLLFGLHPMTVEPIAWVWERKTVLAMFFALLSLIFYLAGVRRGTKWGWQGASLLAFVLSLLAKPTGTPLPVLLLLLDYWPLRRLSWKGALEKIPFFAVAAVSAVITVLSTRNNAGVTMPVAADWLKMPLKIGYLNTFYLGKIVWPSRLSSLYEMPDPMSLSNPWVLAGVLATVILFVAIVFSLRWTRAVLVGWLFFFLAILPTLGVIGYSWVNASDKYAYLPAIGLLLPLAALLDRCMSVFSARAAAKIIMALAVLVPAGAYAVAARSCLRNWQTTESLTRYMVDLAPRAKYPRNDLGAAYLRSERIDEAIACFLEALRLDWNYPMAHYNLGAAYAKKEMYAQAIEHYEMAVKLDGRYADAHNNLGLALMKTGRAQEAVRHYLRAIELDPESYVAHFNLADALAAANRGEEAIRQYRIAIGIRPDLADAYCNLSAELSRQGRYGEAAEEARLAIARRPGYATAHYNLAVGLQNLKNTAEAATHLYEAIRLKPEFAEARNNLGAILFSQGHVDQAMQQFQELVRLKPDWIDARYNLGYILESQGKLPEAAEQYRRILQLDPRNADAKLRLEAIRGRLPQTQAVGPKP